jgi:Ser/Thr protein kinase RdoA (MazF antagonist)
MAQAVRSLSPKQINEIMQLQRQAVMQLARLAAKRAVQGKLREQGVRVTLVPPAEIMRQAGEYLANHPELYQQASERAQRMIAAGVFGKRAQRAYLLTSAQSENEPKSTTSALQISGAK